MLLYGALLMYIAHEKAFWGDDKDDDTEEQQKQKTKLWKEKFLKYMIC